MNHSFSRPSTLATLDIGSSKVCCLIAHITPRDKKIEIVGYGYNASKGIKNGVITDINQATLSVCNAVEDAEQRAKERINSLIVNISGDKTTSVVKSNIIQLHKNRPVSDLDIEKLKAQGYSKIKLPEMEIVHCVPLNYTIDDKEIIKDPHGFYAETLGIDMLYGFYPQLLYKNLANIIENAHLEIALKTFSGYASALACLVEDEKELGATVVDIGGGTTSLTTFKNGFPVHFATLPVGGNNITNDIAWGLTTSFAHAEDLKIRHGCAFLISQDELKSIDVYPVGEEDDNSIRQVPKSDLINIIAPRVEEIFEMVSQKLDEQGLKDVANHRVVLTGGSSALSGIRDVAALILNKQVRLGIPRNIPNIPNYLYDPKYATALGMLLFAINCKEYRPSSTTSNPISLSNMGGFKKILGWFKQNF
ncbi:MAG: cell division protein FtsA [Alphaproteobacteria bacterium]|nr:cell division protein FtsA [Alphaproteobacteria bacterium]